MVFGELDLQISIALQVSLGMLKLAMTKEANKSFLCIVQHRLECNLQRII